MAHRLRRLLLAGSLAAAASLSADAQMRVAPLDMAQGHVALGLALLVGLFLGCLLAMVADYLDRRIKTYGQVRAATGWSTFSVADEILDGGTTSFNAGYARVAFKDTYSSGGSYFVAATDTSGTLGGVFRMKSPVAGAPIGVFADK